jgi:hypothetical protein
MPLVLLGLALTALAGAHLKAQQLGSITGTVTDSSGAVLVDADVKIHSAATGLERATQTNGSGAYDFFDLPPGTYVVTFSKAAFQTTVHSDVLVQANRTTTVDDALRPGAVAVTVEVNATPLMNKVDTTNGYTLSSSAIQAMPLGTGSFTQLATLSPGVNADLLNGSGTNTGLGNQEIWANGQRSTSNSISFNSINADNLFNGATSSSVSSNRFVLSTGEQFGANGDVITATSVFDAIGEGIPTPPPETIEEIHVSTSMFDASEGSKSGAHIEVTTKSGTNAFHGQAYEYLQNDVLNASPFFYNAANLPKPALRRNTFGATFGGPIKRDKAFFFGSYQGVRVSDQENGTQDVTVPEALTDDRSAGTLAQTFGISNPTTISQSSLAILNAKAPGGGFLVPTPNVSPALAPTLGYDAVNTGPPSRFTVDQFNGNVDYNFSPNDRLAGKYFYQRNPTVTPFAPDAELLGFGQTLSAGSQAISLDNTRILRPNVTWELKGGFIREGRLRRHHAAPNGPGCSNQLVWPHALPGNPDPQLGPHRQLQRA